jgi:Universal stress protein family
MFKKIAVAFDESPAAGRAFRSGLDLAKLTGRKLPWLP